MIRSLASGGFGTVYEVKHRRTGESAALKLLHAHLVTSAETLARFEREIRVVGSLQHHNVVRLVDAGFSTDGRPYLCMELLDGEELSRIVEREGRLSTQRALAILEPVCDALALAHERGIVHRDIKSSNIMVCSDGRIVLLDFGIAKISDALAPELTATNQSLGTPSCMAPEQIQGLRPDARTDVYALGGLLFHMLTGRMPFQDPSATMTQYLHLHARRPRASLVAHGIPERLDDVIARAMAIEPANRFPDAASLLAAALAASREASTPRDTSVHDTIALYVSVADRTGGSAFDVALFDDLESVLPAAERYLAERSVTLAVDLGSSALFVAPRERVEDPVGLAQALARYLEERPRRDARVQVGVAVHCDAAPFVGAQIQPCPLLRPTTWQMPDSIEGIWISPALTAGASRTA